MVRSSWSRGSVPSSHARGQRFEPRRRQYFKLLLDPGDFHSNPSRLLSFNKSKTVLWTIAKILYIILLLYFSLFQIFTFYKQIEMLAMYGFHPENMCKQIEITWPHEHVNNHNINIIILIKAYNNQFQNFSN